MNREQVTPFGPVLKRTAQIELVRIGKRTQLLAALRTGCCKLEL